MPRLAGPRQFAGGVNRVHGGEPVATLSSSCLKARRACGAVRLVMVRCSLEDNDLGGLVNARFLTSF
jgi:hypothetical protein